MEILSGPGVFPDWEVLIISQISVPLILVVELYELFNVIRSSIIVWSCDFLEKNEVKTSSKYVAKRSDLSVDVRAQDCLFLKME